MNIPQIVADYVIKTQGRMPETESEVDEYLDLINHLKEYAEAVEVKYLIGERLMIKWGWKTPERIKQDWEMSRKTPSPGAD